MNYTDLEDRVTRLEEEVKHKLSYLDLMGFIGGVIIMAWIIKHFF